jgi:hypothetical protein
MVLGDVPKSDRCRCREAGAAKAAATRGAGKTQPAAPEGTLAKFAAWLRK